MIKQVCQAFLELDPALKTRLKASHSSTLPMSESAQRNDANLLSLAVADGQDDEGDELLVNSEGGENVTQDDIEGFQRIVKALGLDIGDTVHHKVTRAQASLAKKEDHEEEEDEEVDLSDGTTTKQALLWCAGGVLLSMRLDDVRIRSCGLKSDTLPPTWFP